MRTINLFDKTFAHSIGEDGFDTASAGRKPEKVQWIRNNFKWDGVTIFTDAFIPTDIPADVDSSYKVAWLMESPAIHPWVYEAMPEKEHHYDKIITHHPDLLKRGDKYVRYTVGSLRVKDKDFGIHPKTKGVSVIASDKNHTAGHQLRHQLIGVCPELDKWGSGYNRFEDKTEPLKDYMFSVAILNHTIDNYFTEILTDCFALGTVPIFWGTPNIGEFFDEKGIIRFENIEEFSKIKLSKQLYEDMMPHIKRNYEIASKYYKSTDDIIANIIEREFYNKKLECNY